MKVLIACEFSGTVRDAFRKRAYGNAIVPQVAAEVIAAYMEP